MTCEQLMTYNCKLFLGKTSDRVLNMPVILMSFFQGLCPSICNVVASKHRFLTQSEKYMIKFRNKETQILLRNVFQCPYCC